MTNEQVETPRPLSPAARKQRQLAPAKSGAFAADPRSLFADSTVRSSVAVLFNTTPRLSEWVTDAATGQRVRVPLKRLRNAVRRYVLLELVFFRAMAQFVSEGDLLAERLFDVILRLDARLDAKERTLGIISDRRFELSEFGEGDLASALARLRRENEASA